MPSIRVLRGKTQNLQKSLFTQSAKNWKLDLVKRNTLGGSLVNSPSKGIPIQVPIGTGGG